MQYCLINDQGTGSALIGTMSVTASEFLAHARKVVDMTKKAGETSDWHHPKYATFLRIREGSHMIYVQSPGGVQSLKLSVGDEILFIDFAPKRIESPIGFHPGHWSQALEAVVADKWEFSPEEAAEHLVLASAEIAEPTPEEVGWELLLAA